MGLEPRGGCFLWKEPVPSGLCVSIIICGTSLAFVDFKYTTPGAKECPGIWNIGADTLNIDKQAKVISESFLTSVGPKNLVVSMAKATKWREGSLA